MLGLAGSRDKELEIDLAELERLKAKGDDDLIAFLNEQTGRSASALTKALTANLDGDRASRCRAVCGNDEKLWQRVCPFGGLLRRHVRLPGRDLAKECVRCGGNRPAFQRDALHAPHPHRTHRPVHVGAAGLRRSR